VAQEGKKRNQQGGINYEHEKERENAALEMREMRSYLGPEDRRSSKNVPASKMPVDLLGHPTKTSKKDAGEEKWRNASGSDDT
jgi:hypothetical protein